VKVIFIATTLSTDNERHTIRSLLILRALVLSTLVLLQEACMPFVLLFAMLVTTAITPFGIQSGFPDLIAGQVKEMQWMDVDSWLSRSGIELGTDRVTSLRSILAWSRSTNIKSSTFRV
jgi:hypothetical protein